LAAHLPALVVAAGQDLPGCGAGEAQSTPGPGAYGLIARRLAGAVRSRRAEALPIHTNRGADWVHALVTSKASTPKARVCAK